MKPRPIKIDGDVAYITLTQGYTATIDAADVPLVGGYNWCAVKLGNGHNIYAQRFIGKNEGGPTCVYLHRAIIGDTDGLDIDHIDGNGLNNRRINLRLATRSQNSWNARPQKNAASKYKGVASHKASGKWQVRIRHDEKQIWLGYYDDEEAAHAAYCEASERLHGEFGRTE